MIKYSKSEKIKEIGNRREKEFANRMFNAGWWVHILANNTNGQPFDIVMTKNNITWFLDVKNVATGDVFTLDRIEENQINAFDMLVRRGTTNCGLAIVFDDNVFYLLEYKMMKDLLENRLSTVTKSSLKKII
jgi:hypothetical protein